jgi:hypothetical protein
METEHPRYAVENGAGGPEGVRDLGDIERWIIKVVATLQGLALLVADHFFEDFSNIVRLAWYAGTLAGTATIALCLRDHRDARPWMFAAAAVALNGALAAYGGSHLDGGQSVADGIIVVPLALSLIVLLFVSLPFAQTWLDRGKTHFNYPDLFAHAWDNGLALAIAGIFTLLFWLLLFLWQKLFGIIGIAVFENLFANKLFYYPVTGIVVGVGLVAGRTQHRATSMLLAIVLAIFRGLLPVVGLIAILFILSLPSTGLEPLWGTRIGAGILMTFLLVLIIFTNGVYQDGSLQPPYPIAVRRLVEAALLVAPIFGLLAGYALWLRVMQYGWTVDRVWAAIICLFLFLYACGYATSVVRRGTSWLAGISRWNTVLAAAVMAVLVAVNLPWINPRAIAVASQVQRLASGEVMFDAFDLNFLRFRAGREGLDALRELRNAPELAGKPFAQAVIERALAAKHEGGSWNAPDEKPSSESVTARLKRVPEDLILPTELMDLLLNKEQENLSGCVTSSGRCVLIAIDLNRDGNPEMVFVRADNAYTISVFGRMGDKNWALVARGDQRPWSGKPGPDFWEELNEGRVAIVVPKWDKLRIGDLEYSIREP